SALLWTNVGNANARLGNDAEAELAYRRALAIDAEYRDAMNNLAWILLQQKRSLAEAESLARRAAAMSGPDTYVYEMTFAKLLAARGKCAEAKEIGARLSTSAPPAVDTAIVCGQ
ncbi:MAG TPA: tetratricopeptide repeat protein, partial [Thermoanaerobaculia bacterium]